MSKEDSMSLGKMDQQIEESTCFEILEIEDELLDHVAGGYAPNGNCGCTNNC